MNPQGLDSHEIPKMGDRRSTHSANIEYNVANAAKYGCHTAHIIASLGRCLVGIRGNGQVRDLVVDSSRHGHCESFHSTDIT